MAIDLELLGSRYKLSSNDSRMSELMSALWAPFLAPSVGTFDLDVRVLRIGDEWECHSEGRATATQATPWRAAIQARIDLVEAAVEHAESIVDLHAAALVREDSAILLVGEAYAGKTSFALCLAEEGWDLYGDDLAPIDVGSGTITPFPKPIGVKTRRWNDCLWLWDRPPELRPTAEEAFLVPATKLLRRQDRARKRIGHIVFLDYREGEPARLETLSASKATALCGAHIRRISRDALATLAGVCSTATTANLTYSSIKEGLRLIRELTA